MANVNERETLLKVDHLCQYFGPTKAELSLVWLIGQNNFNQKGGNK